MVLSSVSDMVNKDFIVLVQCVISRDILSLSFSSSASCPPDALTLSAVKRKIRDETGFRLDMMQLSYHGQLLRDDDQLPNHGDVGVTPLMLEIKPPQFSPHPSQKGYEGFLQRVQYIDTIGNELVESEVTTSPTIILHFRKDKYRNRLDFNSLLEVVESDGEVSMMQTFGYSEAQKRGFTQWTSGHLVFERLMLLEMNAGGMGGKEEMEFFRYNYDGINQFYMGGDRHSWQRYTKHVPIPCSIKVEHSLQQVKISPRETLKTEKEYVLLLMHGGRILKNKFDTDDIIPHADEDDLEYVKDDAMASVLTVLSDHLVFFKTTRAQVDQVNQTYSKDSHRTSTLAKKCSSTDFSNVFHRVEFSISQTHCSRKAFIVSLSNADHGVPVKCIDLKNAIYDCIGLAIRDQQLVINGQISLDDNDDLNSFRILRHSDCPSPCLRHTNRVQLVPVVPILRSNMLPLVQADITSVQPYIRNVFPPDGIVNVSTNVIIRIQFQEAHTESTCSVIDIDCFAKPLKEVCSDSFRQWNSMRDMEDALGSEEARRRGFVKWCGHSGSMNRLDQKLRVVEIEGDVEAIRRDRYQFLLWRGRNGKYHGGDCFSWQRYTCNEPIQGVIEIDYHDQSVIFRPSSPLKANTTYAIVILNGLLISCHSKLKVGRDLEESSIAQTCSVEDFLSFFSTEVELTHNTLTLGPDNNNEELTDDGGQLALSMCYGVGSDDTIPCSIS